jgi:integrase
MQGAALLNSGSLERDDKRTTEYLGPSRFANGRSQPFPFRQRGQRSCLPPIIRECARIATGNTSLASYRDAFVLLRFLAASHRCDVVDLKLDHLGAEDVLAFLDHLEPSRRNSVATRNARLAAIHAFARFVATRHPERIEPAQRLLAMPTKRGPSVDYLEADEVRAMLEAVPRHTRASVRDHYAKAKPAAVPDIDHFVEVSPRRLFRSNPEN